MPSTVAPPHVPPPSFVRRHPIVAGFGVLSGLSLFSALWPVSAIVISVAIAAHVTGVDRVAWSLTRRVATRISLAVNGRRPGAVTPPASPAPSAPAPTAPEPPGPTAPSGPRHAAHPPSAVERVGREARVHRPPSRVQVRRHGPKGVEHPVEAGVDGPEL